MIVPGLLYVLFGAGLLLMEYPTLKRIALGVSRRMRTRRRLPKEGARDEYRSYGRILRHVRKLLDSAGSGYFRNRPDLFLLFSIGIGAAVFMTLVWIEGIGFSCLAGTLAAAGPYLLLRVRLSGQRIGNSREGDTMLRELMNQYKIRDCNMKEAISAAAENLDDAPHAKHLLLELAKGLNRAYTEEEIRRQLEIFRYSIGTSWGSALASVIYFSHVRGIYVTEALEDLSDSLIRSRQVVEQARRENNEPTLILRFLAPVSYGLAVLAAFRFFHFTPGKFIRYQFGTAIGIRWFLIMAAAFLAGLALEVVLTKEKMDI